MSAATIRSELRVPEPGNSWTNAFTVLATTLALAGVGVALYLSVVHYAHQPIACNGIGECEYVNSSEYAKVAGIPVAVLGALSYGLIAALAILWRVRNDATLLLSAWGIALASFGFSLYLTYVELEVLEAICVYCVASASIVSALFLTLSALVWLQRREFIGDG
jgi:uncharacterized membrane protein